MAITLTQTPLTTSPSLLNCPAYNDQWFCATSTQTAQPNFQFYVTVTVHYHNGTSYTTKVYNEAINNPTDSVLRFNAKSYPIGFIKHYIPISLSAIWRTCTNGCLKIVVNVGERYGTTPTIYTGTNTTYYVWNASLSFKDFKNFSPTNYISSSGSAFVLLNDYPDNNATSYSQNFLYIYCSSDNVVSKARITSVDSGGTPASFDITNTMLASGNWYDRYICLTISPYYLAAAGGVNWVAANGTTYTVDLYDAGNVKRYTASFVYNDVCEKYWMYQQIYLNNKGAFDFMNFELISENNYEMNRTKIKTTPYTPVSGATTQSYELYSSETKTNTVEYLQSLKLNSNSVTENQVASLLYLIASPVVYLQDLEVGNTTGIYAVNNADTKYLKNQYFNNKVYYLTAQIDLSHSNYSQRGA